MNSPRRQDLRSARHRRGRATKSFFHRYPILEFIGITFGLVLPIFAHAGFLSAVENFLSSPANAAGGDTPIVNSQNIQLLKGATNHNPSSLKGGSSITIVSHSALLAEAGPSGTLADIPEQPTSDQISIYVVRKGDTLAAIAKMFGVSVNTIVWANDIQRGVIHEGETLVILPISGIEHTVVKGETLQSIAKKYKGDVNDIIQFNSLNPDEPLAVGDIVIIPDGEIAAAPVSSGSVPTSALHGAGGPSYNGYYAAPLANYRKTQGLHGFNGVDLAAPYGSPIMAAAAGQVIIARAGGWNGGYGTYVVIAHNNGTQTLYAHMSALNVSAGQFVAQGQVIGYEGQTGKATGPHLHFEVRGAKNPF